jgi:tetratricopeptide (TPR) repeat protein
MMECPSSLATLLKYSMHFCTSAVGLKPDFPKAHYNLANALAAQGKIREAVNHYTEALRLAPDSPGMLDNLAWILATDSRAEIRDPAKAVQLAERACEQTGHEQAALLDTLAAAYAAADRFPEAAQTAQKALELTVSSGREELARGIRTRLLLYRAGRPYRQPAQPRNPARP